MAINVGCDEAPPVAEHRLPMRASIRRFEPQLSSEPLVVDRRAVVTKRLETTRLGVVLGRERLGEVAKIGTNLIQLGRRVHVAQRAIGEAHPDGRQSLADVLEAGEQTLRWPL